MHKLIEHSGKTCQKRMIERSLRLLALLCLNGLDHAAHCEQRIKACRFEISQGLGPLRHRPCLSKRRFVQANLGPARFSPNAEVQGAIAARELLLSETSHPDLKRLETRRETQTKFETAAIDAARLPRPDRVPMHAVRASEASHAFKGHLLAKPCDFGE